MDGARERFEREHTERAWMLMHLMNATGRYDPPLEMWNIMGMAWHARQLQQLKDAEPKR